jgi:hypothetical protein
MAALVATSSPGLSTEQNKTKQNKIYKTKPTSPKGLFALTMETGYLTPMDNATKEMGVLCSEVTASC